MATCRPEAPSLLRTGPLAFPSHKTSVCCSLPCAMGENTVSAFPPGDYGTGMSLAVPSQPLGTCLSGLTATFQGLFSSTSQKVQVPGPTSVSFVLFFFYKPCLHPTPTYKQNPPGRSLKAPGITLVDKMMLKAYEWMLRNYLAFYLMTS